MSVSILDFFAPVRVCVLGDGYKQDHLHCEA